MYKLKNSVFFFKHVWEGFDTFDTSCLYAVRQLGLRTQTGVIRKKEAIYFMMAYGNGLCNSVDSIVAKCWARIAKYTRGSHFLE